MASDISFTVNQGLDAVTRQGLVEAARDAESKGFTTFTVADHFNTPMAPFGALAIAAEATESLRIAPYVLDNDFRHPAVTAREITTLDELSRGRLDFGIGAGWKEPEYREAGFVFDRAGVRIARLEEAIEICVSAFGGQPVHHAGRFYQLDGFVCRPRPRQRPHPPIMIGGGSPRILGVAARWADIVSVAVRATGGGRLDGADVTAAAAERKMAVVREAAGERFGALRFNAPLMDVVIGPDRRALARAKLDELRSGTGLMAWTAELTEDDLLDSPYLLLGTVGDIVEHLRLVSARFGFTSWSQLGRTTADLAPVIEAIG